MSAVIIIPHGLQRVLRCTGLSEELLEFDRAGFLNSVVQMEDPPAVK